MSTFAGVAKVAGVSKSTASRALSGRGSLSNDAKLKVSGAADQQRISSHGSMKASDRSDKAIVSRKAVQYFRSVEYSETGKVSGLP